MNIVDRNLQKDGIIVTEKIDTETTLKITQNVSKRIANTFPSLNVNEEEIFSTLFSLNMYRANMPEGMAEANYCYKNASIYFNSHIANEDLEEFAIHECLHYLQEVKDKSNKIKKMGLSRYSKFKVTGTAINEAAVQYMSSKIIGIAPSFEKYYNINLYTPSPSYYPVECSLLNELVYFVGENVLYKSTFFSTDDFKNEIIKLTSKKVFEQIQLAFDNILNCEEQILLLNNSEHDKDYQEKITKYRENIESIFIQTQNLIIEEFFNSEFNSIKNLEQLENFRRKLSKIKPILGSIDEYKFFENYYLEMMNKLEHKSNILENGGTETAVAPKISPILNLFTKLKYLLFYKKIS